MSAGMQPTLLNGCARAATAAEVRFRIDRAIPGRSARVVALDHEAAQIAGRAAEQAWHDARFFTCDDRGSVDSGGNGASADLDLRAIDGSRSPLSQELADADIVVMIATSDEGVETGSSIAHACAERGVMTAVLVVGELAGAAVSALRPYAPVLLVSDDEGDLPELLTALRA